MREATDSTVSVGAAGIGTLRDCRVETGRASGLVVENGGELTVLRTHVTDCGAHGVLVSNGGRATLTNCQITGSVGDGVRIDTSEPVTVTGCTVRDNRGAGLRQSRANERLTVEDLSSAGNAAPDAWGDTLPHDIAAASATGEQGKASPQGPLAELESLVGRPDCRRRWTDFRSAIALSAISRDSGGIGLGGAGTGERGSGLYGKESGARGGAD
jgi:hypothetical protein